MFVFSNEINVICPSYIIGDPLRFNADEYDIENILDLFTAPAEGLNSPLNMKNQLLRVGWDQERLFTLG